MPFSTFRYAMVSLLTLTGFLYGIAQSPFSVEPIVLKSEFGRQKITPKASIQPLKFTGLKLGETYQLLAPPNAETSGCVPTISIAGNFASAENAPIILTFVATAKEMSFVLHFPCTWAASNIPIYTISLSCTSCSLVNKFFNAPDEVLSVDGIDPDAAVREVLIGGNCFDVDGINLCGGGGALGTFTGGQTNIGFNKGMILATGPVSIAPGPNSSDGAGSSAGSCGPDGDLASLSTGAQFDVARLEFDFTPTQPQVVFRYVFASEEYCEYVGSQFNDVFGFFISGPGIPGGVQNIATVPMSPTPVAINNVNHQTNAGFYVNNQPAGSGNLCGQNPSSSNAVNEVQYDGYTRKFVASATVIPCQTYHIKLVIADIGDSAWDSAVFVDEGSFDAGGNASVEWLVNGEPDVNETFEKCGDAALLFDRVGGNPNVPMTVSFTITGTATSGLDYKPIPSSITIPAGQDQFLLPVTILSDLLVEGQESIKITLTNLCSCLMPQEILLINDLPALTTKPDTVVICGGGVAVLDATYLGGVPDYTFQWSNNGGTAQQAAFFVNNSGTYKVTITDECGQTTVQSIYVRVNPPPKAQLLPPAPQLCADGGSGLLKVVFTGNGPFELVYSINGNPQDPITDITDNPYFLEVNEIGLYTLNSVTDFEGCQGTGQGTQLVVNSQLKLTGVTTNVQCFGQTNGTINTTVTGGGGPYNYVWDGPVTIPNIPDPINLQAGVYNVTLTDGYNCSLTNSFTVQAASVLVPVAAQAQIPNCTNPNGGSINLTVNGGFPNYTYKWSNNTTSQNPQNLPAGTYTVTVTDQSGCTRTATTTVVANTTPPIAVGVAIDDIDCQTLSVQLNGQGSSVGSNFSYLWSVASPTGNIVGSTNTLDITVNQGGTYRIRVTDSVNGCTSTADVPVVSNVLLPVADAGPPQVVTCAIGNVTLDGSGSSSSANNFTYAWTASNGGTIAGGANTTQPIASSVGTYTLLVTNNINFCTATDNVVVTSNFAPPTAVIAAPGIINCVQNQVILNASGSSPSNVFYNWGTLNGNIISGFTTANPVVTEAGDYVVTVTNPGNGCTSTASKEVKEDQSVPSVLAFSNESLDCNTSTVIITGQNPTNDGSPVWTVSQGGNIVGSANTLNITVDKPGLYTLTVTNPISKCSASASKLVEQNIQPPVAIAGPPGTLNCYNNNSLTIGDPNAFLIDTKFQWTASNGGNIQGPTNQSSATVNKAGTYSIVVTNQQNGCTNTASVTIAQDITPPNTVVAPAGQINCQNSFVQLNGVGSSTGPIYGYDWTTPNGSISIGTNTLTPVVTAPGTYQLLVTNNVNGCKSSATATVISDLNLPSFAIQAAPPITCLVDKLTLNASVASSGNFTYQWGSVDGAILSGANTLNPVVTKSGTYTLIVTNTANNCSAVENVVVIADNIPPAINAGPNQTLNCTEPTLTINGTGPSSGHTYKWVATDGGNILLGANTLTPSIDKPGTYTLTATNNTNGCTSTSVAQIAQDAGQPVVQIAAPPTLTCTTQQVNINAAGSSTGSNYVYEWSGLSIINGINSLNPTVDKPGTYTVTITNTSNGCTQTATTIVPENIAKPVADAGPANTLNCYQAELQIGGTTISTGPDFTYVWSGPGIVSGIYNAQPIVNQPGVYDVTVTNIQNGCTQVGNVDLAANFTTPTVDAGPSGLITCTDNFYETTPSITGTGPFTYNWETTGGSFLNGAIGQSQLNPILNGAGFYYLTVTNTTSGCTSTDVMQVYESADFPEADAGFSDLLTCNIQQLTLDGSSSSQNGPYTYQWIPTSGGNIVSGGNTLYPVIDAPGTYSLAVRDTSNSCISYSMVEISQNITPPDAEAGAPVTLTCSVNSVTLDGDVNSNGSFTYSWTAANGGNILSGETTLSPEVNAVGIYTLKVTNTSTGCTDTDQVNVLADQNAPIVAIAQPAILNCNIDFVLLNASGSSTGNVTYNWVSPNGNFIDLSDSSKVKVNAPGVYQLVIQDMDNNCASLASVTVVQDITAPIAQAGMDTRLDCKSIISTLDGLGSSSNGNFFYQWSTPNGEILADPNSLTPTVSASGTYLLTVVNTDNGCKSTDLVVVNEDINQPDIVIVIPALITCFASEVVLDGSNSSTGNVYSYAWTTPNGNIINGATAPQAVVNTPGLYTLTVLNNDNGCANASTTTVEENTVPPSVQILPPGTITCADPVVGIIALAESGSQYVFGWSTIDGNIVSGETSLQLLVDKPGNYNVLVVNNNNGCAALANTNVLEVLDRPNNFEFTLGLPGCRDNDGLISFDSVMGGIEPYLYSINGGNSFANSISFGGLAPGIYELLVQDINGCEYSEDLEIPAAIDPSIDVTPQFNLLFGDSLQLNAVLPPGFPLDLIDTITWEPLTFLTFSGTTVPELLSPICKPFNTIQYKVSVLTKNGGCEAYDRIAVLVDAEPHIYIPNVFTPDNSADPANTIFYIHADDKRKQIKQVNSFQIFDRWGEKVHFAQNFQPNDPAYGWDGQIGGEGKSLTPAVFVYYAEIELIDGQKILYEGDVTLVR